MTAEQKEYVLLEFEDGWVPAANTRFSLSGLDTLNPVLEFEDGTKMIGRYEETIGTCILFSHEEKGVHPGVEEGESKLNRKEGESKATRKELAMEPNPLYVRTWSSDVPCDEHKTRPFCSLQKKLKFRHVENAEQTKKVMLYEV